MIDLRVADASAWEGRADAVFTNPYAPLPSCLHGLPSIISLYFRDENELRQRIVRTEKWIGNFSLGLVGYWGRERHNAMFVANLPVREADLTDLLESHTPYVEGVGWFPLLLCFRMLRLYSDVIRPPMVVWDGFAGRGSVSKACEVLGLNSVSLDIDPSRVEIARDFLGL